MKSRVWVLREGGEERQRFLVILATRVGTAAAFVFGFPNNHVLPQCLSSLIRRCAHRANPAKRILIAWPNVWNQTEYFWLVLHLHISLQNWTNHRARYLTPKHKISKTSCPTSADNHVLKAHEGHSVLKACPTGAHERNIHLVHVAQKLATNVLATSFLVVKDTGGGGLGARMLAL